MRYTIVIRNGIFYVKDTKTNSEVAFFTDWNKAKEYCNGKN